MNPNLDNFANNRLGRYNEKRDCTIRAMVSACGMNYTVVSDYFRTCGKRRNCGFRFRDWLANHGNVAFGYRFTLVSTVEPQGRFVLRTKGHVWAYVDGVHYDAFRDRRQVTHIWKLTPEADTRTADLVKKSKLLNEI